MFSSLNGMISKIKATKIVQNISDNIQKIKHTVRKKIPLIEVSSNIFHIAYPQSDTLQDLKDHIAESQFQIWNISEYRYDQDFENKLIQNKQKGEIHHLCFQYYSSLPLYQLIIAINSIHAFITLNPTNKVYIHCQDNKIRSSIFLTCLIYKFNLNNILDLSEAILYVNKKLQVKIEVQQKQSQTSNYKNLHTFFKNFINYLNCPQIINRNKLELLKIIVNEAPKIKLTNTVIGKSDTIKELKVGIQIRCKQKVIFKSLYDSSVFQGDSMCIPLDKKTIILGDDFIVLLKYIYQTKVYNIMRIQLNTNFILQMFFRTHQQYIDLSSYCIYTNPAAMFIDFMFQENHQLSDLAKLQNSVPVPPKQKDILQEQKPSSINLQSSNKPIQEHSEESFSLHEHDENDHQVDQTEINNKIQQVLKSINKQPGQQEEKQDSQQQDLDDYLSKLESKA